MTRDELRADAIRRALRDIETDTDDRHMARLLARLDEIGPAYPHEDGDVTVIGPECFASPDGSVLSWRGVNYVPQPEPDPQAAVKPAPRRRTASRAPKAPARNEPGRPTEGKPE